MRDKRIKNIKEDDWIRVVIFNDVMIVLATSHVCMFSIQDNFCDHAFATVWPLYCVVYDIICTSDEVIYSVI